MFYNCMKRILVTIHKNTSQKSSKNNAAIYLAETKAVSDIV